MNHCISPYHYHNDIPNLNFRIQIFSSWFNLNCIHSLTQYERFMRLCHGLYFWIQVLIWETFAIIEVMLSTFILFSHIFKIRLSNSQLLSAIPTQNIARAYSVRHSSSWRLLHSMWGIWPSWSSFHRRFYRDYLTNSFDPKPTGVPVDFKLMIKSFAKANIQLYTRGISHIALCLLQVN